MQLGLKDADSSVSSGNDQRAEDAYPGGKTQGYLLTPKQFKNAAKLLDVVLEADASPRDCLRRKNQAPLAPADDRDAR